MKNAQCMKYLLYRGIIILSMSVICARVYGQNLEGISKCIAHELDEIAKVDVLCNHATHEGGKAKQKAVKNIINTLPASFEEAYVIRGMLISRGYPDIMSIKEIKDSLVSFVVAGRMAPPDKRASWAGYFSGMDGRTMRRMKIKSPGGGKDKDQGFADTYRAYVMSQDLSGKISTAIFGTIKDTDRKMSEEFPENFEGYLCLQEICDNCVSTYMYSSPFIDKSEYVKKVARIASDGIWMGDHVSELYGILLDYMEQPDGINVIIQEMNQHDGAENVRYWSMVFGGPHPKNYIPVKERIKSSIMESNLHYSYIDSIDKGYKKALEDRYLSYDKPIKTKESISRSLRFDNYWSTLYDCADELFRLQQVSEERDEWINEYLLRIDYPLVMFRM